ncbi:helix-turn-helix domain-containing protein [Affinibrenneria salicis]|uniref:Helix-turn-helix domain-containing protein n=1 Tax=Affinibrenneria salicis TaxID=2590031 RepID=A0A5J5FTQ5_9GAMM|nr:helix-turn-helix domain-containing protein [Affinibrenneria salicis]KAA8996619.1 helix-turn-helix domain-containing protein [Affinibrenneria salicis]
MNQDNLKLVGDFLRAKRESIAPETMGLTKPTRTRTTGLRRDDVAYFSGISTVWYSKIERGQATGISAQVLISISKTLRLTKAEYEYLCNLISPQSRSHKDPCCTISGHTSQLLLQLNPLPSLLQNDYLDIITCNKAFSLMIGFSIDDLPFTEKNYLYLTINNPAWRKFLCIDNDEKLARQITRMAGFLRDTLAKQPDDEILKKKVGSFRKLSTVFDKAWAENTVLQPEELSYVYKHAGLGNILLDKQLWWNFGDDSSSRLNIYYPQHEVDRQRLLEIMQ